jgi:hypothetical protein
MEVIAGVRTLLKEKIAPNLAPEAHAELKRVLSVLRDGRWNDAAFDLLRENAALAKLAKETAHATDSLTPHTEAFMQVRTLLAPQRSASDLASFDEANAENWRLRSGFSLFIEIVRDRKIEALDPVCRKILVAMLELQRP